MPTSDEDLQKLRDDVQALRDQRDQAKREIAQKAADLVNDVTANQLKAEQESLQAELAQLRSQNTKKAVAEGAAGAIDPEGTAERQAKAAEAAEDKSSTESPRSTKSSGDSSKSAAAGQTSTSSKSSTKAGS